MYTLSSPVLLQGVPSLLLKEFVEVNYKGEAVGMITQSIGEPGTQLTMYFYVGGTAQIKDESQIIFSQRKTKYN